MRRIIVATVALVLAGCSQARVKPFDPQLASDYQQLVSMFPEEHQGLGPEVMFKTAEEQPMTYGLILSAESARYARTAAPEARRRIRNAGRWVIDNQDTDGDGRPGWGLPQAWDAFQDGTTNPPQQPYTITTALVMYGLLDSLKTDAWSAAEREDVKRLLARVAVRWCDFWSEGYGGGFFWYSPSRADAIFAVNSPSMMMGALARLVHEQPDVFTPEDRALVQRRVDDQARAVVATVVMKDGMPYWAYMPLPNFRNSEGTNDLIHHVYTLWGIEVYRDLGGAVQVPWSREAAVRSLDQFWRDGQIRQLPEIVLRDQAAKTSATTKPAAANNPHAVLWSAGMLLASYAQLGDGASTARTLAVIKRDYGPWPNLTLYPPQRSKDTKFYPRYAAHVLIGLAWDVFGIP